MTSQHFTSWRVQMFRLANAISSRVSGRSGSVENSTVMSVT
jgi:hypothetical protein